MTLIKVRATYTNGWLKPATPLNLPDGASVEVEIASLPLAAADTPASFGSLAGIWSHLSDADVQAMEQDLAAVRAQWSAKIDRQMGDQTHDQGQ